MPARLEISTEAFRGNIAEVTRRLAPAELMLVTKDDAYGLGLQWAVTAALSAGVRWFGSYDIPSAVRIRDLAPACRIFAWAIATDAEIAAAIDADIDLGVGTIPYLRRVVAQAARHGRRARVHLKIDTGLHRNGIRPEQWPAAVAEARTAEDRGLVAVAGLWSHLSEASDAEDDDSQRVFHAALTALEDAGAEPSYRHLTASAASWWRPELRGNLCRIGAFCYGIRSADGPDLEGLRQVAALRADAVEVRDDRVRIDIGHLDGLPSTLVGARIGDGSSRISRIESTWTELEGADGLRPGDGVTLFGPGGVSATDLGERIGTVGEEILTRISPLVARHRM